MSIRKWFSAVAGGGDAAATAQLESSLNELYLGLAPLIRAGSLKSIAVASPESGEGRSRVALLLAEVLADSLGERVLLVDADSHRPSLHTAYGVENELGLSDVLAGEAELREVVRPTLRDNQDLLTVGTAPLEPGETVGRSAVDSLLADARSDYAVVIFDTGPLLVDQDALVFCHSVAGVVLVLMAGVTQGELLAKAQRLLQRSQSHLLGLVVNDPRGEFVQHES